MFNLNSDNWISRFFARLTDLFLLQMLFILTSIPLVTIGAGICALYSVCRKLRQDSISGVTAAYFQDFAANWKQATAAWLLFPVAGFVVFAGLQYYTAGGVLSILGRVLIFLAAAVVCLVFLYLFPMIAWLENPLFLQMKNALVLSLAHIPATILELGTLVAAYFIARFLYPLFLFVGVSATIYILSGFFLKTLSIYSPDLIPQEIPQEENPEDETAETENL